MRESGASRTAQTNLAFQWSVVSWLMFLSCWFGIFFVIVFALGLCAEPHVSDLVLERSLRFESLDVCFAEMWNLDFEFLGESEVRKERFFLFTSPSLCACVCVYVHGSIFT